MNILLYIFLYTLCFLITFYLYMYICHNGKCPTDSSPIVCALFCPIFLPLLVIGCLLTGFINLLINIQNILNRLGNKVVEWYKSRKLTEIDRCKQILKEHGIDV